MVWNRYYAVARRAGLSDDRRSTAGGGVRDMGSSMRFRSSIKQVLELRKLNSSLLPAVLAIVVFALAVRFTWRISGSISLDFLWQSDFFALWSFAKIALVKPTAEIFEEFKLLQFQMNFGVYHGGTRPFAHTPSFLLMILPLGFLPFFVAYAVWISGTFALYFAASFYRRWRASAIALMILA